MKKNNSDWFTKGIGDIDDYYKEAVENLLISDSIKDKRPDYALALALKGLEWTEKNGEVVLEFFALLQLGLFYRDTHLKGEKNYYYNRLLNLAKKNYKLINEHPLFKQQEIDIGIFLNIIISELPEDEQKKWLNIKDNTNKDYQERSKYFPRHYKIPESLFNKICNVYFIFDSEDIDRIKKINLNRRISNIRKDKKFKLLPKGAKSEFEIHFSLLKAKLFLIKKDYLELFKTCSHILFLPAHHSIYNKNEFIILFLQLGYKIFDLNSWISNTTYSSKYLKEINSIIKMQLKDIYSSEQLSFVVNQIKDIQEVVEEYIDYLMLRPKSKILASRLCMQFQGIFYSVSLGLVQKYNIDEEGVELFTHEYRYLLKHIYNKSSQKAISQNNSHLTKNFQKAENMLGGAKANIEYLEEYNTSSDFKMNLSKIRSILGKNQAILLFYMTRKKIYCSVIEYNQPLKQFEVNVKPSEIYSLSENFSKNKNLPSFILNLENKLDPKNIMLQLINPAIVKLTKHIKRLCIIFPQVELPFHLVFNKKTGLYLIENYAISYALSVFHFYYSKTHSIINKKSIAVSGYESNLKFVNQELEFIKNISTTKKIINDYDYLSKELHKYEIFHYSGHATGAIGKEDWWQLHFKDRQIDVKDLIKSFNKKMNFAVILGCSSSEHVIGEAGTIIGLTGSIIGCGVAQVLGNLWNANDEITFNFAKNFYNDYSINNLSADVALQNSILKLKKNTPLGLWGNFIYYGSS